MLWAISLKACIIKEQSIDDFLGIRHLLQHLVPRGPLSALPYRTRSSVHPAAALKADEDVADEEALVPIEIHSAFLSGWSNAW